MPRMAMIVYNNDSNANVNETLNNINEVYNNNDENYSFIDANDDNKSSYVQIKFSQ